MRSPVALSIPTILASTISGSSLRLIKINNPSSPHLQKLMQRMEKIKSSMLIFIIPSLKDFSLMKKAILSDHKFESLGKFTALGKGETEDL
jgi:hypothetical protein